VSPRNHISCPGLSPSKAGCANMGRCSRSSTTIKPCCFHYMLEHSYCVVLSLGASACGSLPVVRLYVMLGRPRTRKVHAHLSTQVVFLSQTHSLLPSVFRFQTPMNAEGPCAAGKLVSPQIVGGTQQSLAELRRCRERSGAESCSGDNERR
jgi:hypothetical protein